MIVFADTPAQRAEAEADEFMRDRSLIGTPEEIAEGIDQLAAQGFDEFILPDFWYTCATRPQARAAPALRNGRRGGRFAT